MSKCIQCQKILSLPFIVDWESKNNYCFDCFGKIEKDFRGKKMFAYHETNEKNPDGQIGWNDEKNAWITLWDHKYRAVYPPQDREPNDNHNNNKCSKCQGEFTKKDGKLIWWIPRGNEEVHLCCACKDSEQQGIYDYMHDMRSSDPGMERGMFCFCGLCNESIKEKEFHENDGDRRIIKHKCFPKCERVFCRKKFQLTQIYSDLISKHKLDRFCLDCQEKELKQLINIDCGSNKNKEALKELERLTGKGSDDDTRERERESKIETRDCWFRRHC